MEELAATYWELIKVPVRHASTAWGIIPLYFGWLLSGITNPKPSPRTILQTGCGLLWAGAHWAYLGLYSRPAWMVKINFLNDLFVLSVAVTLSAILLGLFAVIIGLRKKIPPGCSLLGRIRFTNYFVISIYGIQANYLQWSWDRVTAILVFALPVWVVLHFALKPWRRR